MSHRWIKGVAAAMILGLGIAACSSGGAKSPPTTTKSVTLTEEATTRVTFTQNFNPFDVPKHVWQSISSPAPARVATPVGTGPYELKSFTTQLVTFSATPHYWGGPPPISQVQIPYYSGNTAATTALAANQLDWAGNE